MEVGVEGADEFENATEEEEGGDWGSWGWFVFGELCGEVGMGDEGGDETDVSVRGDEGGGRIIRGGNAGGYNARERVEGLGVCMWGLVRG